jgi:hypothetical protein
MSSARPKSRVCPGCSQDMTAQEEQAWGMCSWCESLAVQVAPPLIRGRQIVKPLGSKPEGDAPDLNNPQVG